MGSTEPPPASRRASFTRTAATARAAGWATADLMTLGPCLLDRRAKLVKVPTGLPEPA
jgi:hypothetical protein